MKMLSYDECQITCNYNVTHNQINDVINNSLEWVNKNKKRLQQQDQLFKQTFTRDKVLLLGIETKIYYNQLKLYYNYDSRCSTFYSTEHKLSRALKEIANCFLSKRLDELSMLMKINYSKFKISNAKSKWGSCSSAGVIMLNYRVVCLPLVLQDYIIIHELAHIKELNHSKKFWNLVSEFCHDYKKFRDSLKNYAFLFKIE